MRFKKVISSIIVLSFLMTIVPLIANNASAVTNVYWDFTGDDGDTIDMYDANMYANNNQVLISDTTFHSSPTSMENTNAGTLQIFNLDLNDDHYNISIWFRNVGTWYDDDSFFTMHQSMYEPDGPYLSVKTSGSAHLEYYSAFDVSNVTGITLPTDNQWHQLRIKVYDSRTHMKMQLDNDGYGSELHPKKQTSPPQIFYFGYQLGSTAHMYYDDFRITTASVDQNTAITGGIVWHQKNTALNYNDGSYALKTYIVTSPSSSYIYYFSKNLPYCGWVGNDTITRKTGDLFVKRIHTDQNATNYSVVSNYTAHTYVPNVTEVIPSSNDSTFEDTNVVMKLLPYYTLNPGYMLPPSHIGYVDDDTFVVFGCAFDATDAPYAITIHHYPNGTWWPVSMILLSPLVGSANNYPKVYETDTIGKFIMCWESDRNIPGIANVYDYNAVMIQCNPSTYALTNGTVKRIGTIWNSDPDPFYPRPDCLIYSGMHNGTEYDFVYRNWIQTWDSSGLSFTTMINNYTIQNPTNWTRLCTAFPNQIGSETATLFMYQTVSPSTTTSTHLILVHHWDTDTFSESLIANGLIKQTTPITNRPQSMVQTNYGVMTNDGVDVVMWLGDGNYFINQRNTTSPPAYSTSCTIGFYSHANELLEFQIYNTTSAHLYFAQETMNYFQGGTQTLVGPTVDFSGTPLIGLNYCNVTFTELCNDTVWFNWTFGDGNTSTDANPVHNYTYVGLFTVSLTGTNQNGSMTMTKTDYVEVYTIIPPTPVYPTVNFVGTPRVGVSYCNTTFTALCYNTTSYLWAFGDGTTSTQANPVHNYTHVGWYNVQLIGTNSNGSVTATKIRYIHVTAPSQASTGGWWIMLILLAVLLIMASFIQRNMKRRKV